MCHRLRSLAVGVSAVAMLLLSATASRAVVSTVGTYDAATNANVVDVSATTDTGNQVSLATFTANVAAAFNSNLGGVIDFDNGTLTSTTLIDATYGVSQSRNLTVTNSATGAWSVNTTAVDRTPISGDGRLVKGTDADFVFDFAPTSRVVQAGATILGRDGSTNSNFNVTATFSNGIGGTSTSMITFASNGSTGNAVNDTFAGFVAPAGNVITRLAFDSVSNSFRGLDDLGFVTAAAPKAIQFDFSDPTVGTGAGPVGPAHAAGALDNFDSVWNGVGATDVASGLVYTNGSAATGVAIDLGTETATNSGIINWSNTNLVTRNGSMPQSFQNNAVIRDYTRSDTTGDFAMGARITGLEPGVYAVFAVADDTFHLAGQGNNAPFTIFAGVTPDNANLDFTGLASMTISNNETANWVVGESYALLNVTVYPGDALAIISDRGNPSTQGQFNALQLVRVADLPVPEPMSLSMLLVGAAALLRRRRSRCAA